MPARRARLVGLLADTARSWDKALQERTPPCRPVRLKVSELTGLVGGTEGKAEQRLSRQRPRRSFGTSHFTRRLTWLA